MAAQASEKGGQAPAADSRRSRKPREAHTGHSEWVIYYIDDAAHSRANAAMMDALDTFRALVRFEEADKIPESRCPPWLLQNPLPIAVHVASHSAYPFPACVEKLQAYKQSLKPQGPIRPNVSSISSYTDMDDKTWSDAFRVGPPPNVVGGRPFAAVDASANDDGRVFLVKGKVDGSRLDEYMRMRNQGPAHLRASAEASVVAKGAPASSSATAGGERGQQGTLRSQPPPLAPRRRAGADAFRSGEDPAAGLVDPPAALRPSSSHPGYRPEASAYGGRATASPAARAPAHPSPTVRTPAISHGAPPGWTATQAAQWDAHQQSQAHSRQPAAPPPQPSATPPAAYPYTTSSPYYQ